jgi:DNA-binding ferritin-like protein
MPTWRFSTVHTTERQTLAAALDVELVDLINLGLLTKQAHWNIEGPMFRSLHCSSTSSPTSLATEAAMQPNGRSPLATTPTAEPPPL